MYCKFFTYKSVHTFISPANISPYSMLNYVLCILFHFITYFTSIIHPSYCIQQPIFKFHSHYVAEANYHALFLYQQTYNQLFHNYTFFSEYNVMCCPF